MRTPSPHTLDGITVMRIAGIALTIHPTWVFSLALLSWFSRVAIVDHVARGASPAMAWGIAVGFALAISACIVVHELAHSAVARGYGMPVRRITLFMLGGVSQIEREAPTPRAEYSIAVAGPLASVVLATVLGGVARALNPTIHGLPGAWGRFAFINMVLALFNLLPAFPMDGGRVLRSLLWAGGRDRGRATRWAAATGRAFAATMIAGGGLAVALPLVQGEATGDSSSGLMFMLIGWFLFNAAGTAGSIEGGDRPNQPSQADHEQEARR